MEEIKPVTPEAAKAVVEAVQHDGKCPTCGKKLVEEKEFFREENIWRLIGAIPAVLSFFIPSGMGIQVTKDTYISASFWLLAVGVGMFAWPLFREFFARFGKR